MARIFNTFGPRMHPNDGRVVSNFIIQALQGKDITIYGEPSIDAVGSCPQFSCGRPTHSGGISRAVERSQWRFFPHG